MRRNYLVTYLVEGERTETFNFWTDNQNRSEEEVRFDVKYEAAKREGVTEGQIALLGVERID
ncbi:MAG: hypothetical protein JW702_04785 [Clostridiales bacterium]|nr:hypothetical protein [Clostridiales bacterium]